MVLPASVGSPTTSLCTELILLSEGFWKQACLSPVVDIKVLSHVKSVCLEAGTLCSLLAFENSSDAQSDTHWLGKVGTIAKMGQFYVKYTNTTSYVI